jgi:hypothetical protein
MSDMRGARDSFSQPPPLDIPSSSRFKSAERRISEEAERFFNSARLVPNYEGYFRTFRVALRVVDYEPTEEHVYADWLDLSISNEVASGKASMPLGAEQMTYLAQQQDPSMFVIGRLEAIRQRDYPAIENDYNVRQDIFGAYTLLAAGVHRDTLFPEAIIDHREAS